MLWPVTAPGARVRAARTLPGRPDPMATPARKSNTESPDGGPAAGTMTERVVNSYDRLISLAGMVPGMVIAVLALGVGADVLWRNLGLGGIYWMLESAEYGLLILTMVGLAPVLRAGRHVRVDVIVGLLPDGPRRVVEIIAALVATAIAAILVYCSVLALADAYQSGGTLYKSFTLKEWIPLALLPPAFLLVTIECARQARHSIASRRGRGALQEHVF